MSDSIANGGCCSGTVRPGTYGDASDVAQITVDKCGRITKISNVAISGGGGGSSQWTGTTGNPIYYVPNVGIGSSATPTAKLQVTGNVYVSNAITTTNVFATRYYGDGGLLSNISTFTQPLANLVVSNSVTTTNVFATRYYGDGGLLSNISTFTQPLANLVVSNSVTTTNVFATRYYGDGGLLSNISTFTQPLANLVVSNSVTTTNVFATRYYGDGGLLSNISSSAITQPFANLVVSNSVTTTNVFAAGSIYGNLSYLVNNSNYLNLLPDGSFSFPNNQIDVGSNSLTIKTQSLSGFTWDWNDGSGSLSEVNINSGGINFNLATPSLSSLWYFNTDGSTVLPNNLYASNAVTTANVHVTDTLDVLGSMTANAANATFFFDTFTIPYINTQYLNVSSTMNFTGALATFSNLYVPGNANMEYLSVSNLSVTGNLYVTATNLQTTNALTINNSGTMTAFKVTQNETSIHTHNVAEFWDATTLAMVIDPEGNVGIHTTSSPGYALTVTDPVNFETLYIRGKSNQTTLNVIGNIYASNALTTTNIFATRYYGDGGLLSNISSSAITQPFANLVVSNSVTTTNVFATRYYGDGGLLSNISSSAITQPFANLVVSNSVTTTNVFATQYYGDGGLLSNISSNAITQPFANLVVSNSVTTTNVFATRYYGDGGLLSNISSSAITQPFANLVVSNSVTTTNIFVSSNVVIGPTPTALQANLHVEQGNIFIGNSACIGTVSSTNAIRASTLIFDNTSNSSIVPNKIVLFSNASVGSVGFSVSSSATNAELRYHARGTHIFLLANPPTSEVMRITSTSAVGIGTASPVAKLHISTTQQANTQCRIDSSNIALVTSGGGLVGINILTPSANLHVLGNIYASNAVTTTNLFTTNVTANGIQTIAGLAGLTSLNVTGNVYASNAVTTTNLFTTNVTATGIQTITGLTGLTSLNVTGNIYASNAVTTTNVFAATETLTGTTGQTTLNVTGNLYVSNALTTTNITCAGFTSNISNTIFNYDTLTIPFISCTTLNVASTANVLTLSIPGSAGQTTLSVTGNIYASNAVTATTHYGNVVASNVVVTPATGVTGINVTGNIYASNAVTTTNVFAATESLTGTTGQTTLNVTGNIYASNAVTTTNVFLISSATNGPVTKGALEYNGTSNIFLSSALPIRGLVPSQYFYQLNADVAFGTTSSSVSVSAFPALTTGVTLQPGRYYMKMLYFLQIATSSTAGNTNFRLGWAGGSAVASLSNGGIFVINATNTTGIGSLVGAPSLNIIDFVSTATLVVSDTTTAVSTNTTYYNTIEGTFDITTAGGWYPTATIVSPGTFGATPGVRRGSYIYIQNLGQVGAVNIGGWA